MRDSVFFLSRYVASTCLGIRRRSLETQHSCAAADVDVVKVSGSLYPKHVLF